jgi:hypothetical protein
MNDELERMLEEVVVDHVQVRAQHILVTPKENRENIGENNWSQN